MPTACEQDRRDSEGMRLVVIAGSGDDRARACRLKLQSGRLGGASGCGQARNGAVDGGYRVSAARTVTVHLILIISLHLVLGVDARR